MINHEEDYDIDDVSDYCVKHDGRCIGCRDCYYTEDEPEIIRKPEKEKDGSLNE